MNSALDERILAAMEAQKLDFCILGVLLMAHTGRYNAACSSPEYTSHPTRLAVLRLSASLSCKTLTLGSLNSVRLARDSQAMIGWLNVASDGFF